MALLVLLLAGAVEDRTTAATQNPMSLAGMTGGERPRLRRVLCFKASWCGACRKLERTEFPLLQKQGWRIGDHAGNHVQVIDVDRQPELAQKYGVQSMPTFVLVEDGREIARRGYLSGADIANLYLNRDVR